MSFWIDDLDTFLIDFAIDITVDPAGINQIVRVIFDEDFQDVDMGTYQVDSKNPIITLKTSDVDLYIKKHTVVTINNSNYTVVDIQHDGVGITVCNLSEA